MCSGVLLVVFKLETINCIWLHFHSFFLEQSEALDASQGPVVLLIGPCFELANLNQPLTEVVVSVCSNWRKKKFYLL